MAVEIRVGRCARCGAMEGVTYTPVTTREEGGGIRPGWIAVVSCHGDGCSATRAYTADQITDFLLVLDTVEATKAGGEADGEDQDVGED